MSWERFWHLVWFAICLFVLLLITFASVAAPFTLPPEIEGDLQAYAVRTMRAPEPDAWPLALPMTPAGLVALRCPDDPQNCRSLAAVYDTDRRRIYYSTELDLRTVDGQSYVVHELVHHLQQQRDGEPIGCAAIFRAEREAYWIQNRFRGGMWPVGQALVMARCE